MPTLTVLKVLNGIFTRSLTKIYLVITIKICLEFAKMGQSTTKNKLQLSLSTNFDMVHMCTTTIFEQFQCRSCLKLSVTPETVIDSKFLCHINEV